MKKKLFKLCTVFLAIFAFTACSKHSGKVVDAKSNQPVANATVVHNGVVTHSDSQGKFLLSKFDGSKPVFVKSPGYRRGKAPAQRFTESKVSLEPFQARGVYLSFGALKTDASREAVLALFNESDLNTLVIDVKNERGFISMDSDAGAAIKVARAAPPAIDDMEGFLKELHSKNIYVIGRLQTFRDDALGHDRPDLAIEEQGSGKPWLDGSKMKWGDPFRKEVQDYNIAVAVAAAVAGFDEIQFANINIPGGKVKLSKENNSQNRDEMRREFWGKAIQALEPYGVYISSEFWGPMIYSNDVIGTRNVLREVAEKVDYLSPAVFPADLSGMFPHGRRRALTFPYIAVSETIKKGAELVGSPKKFRPWLQHYQASQLKMVFGGKEVAQQMQGAIDAGASGFLLWHGASRYTNTVEALKLFANGMAKPEIILAAKETPASDESPTILKTEKTRPAVKTAGIEANTNNLKVANP